MTTAAQLAQDIRNAYDSRDRDALERAIARIAGVVTIVAGTPPPRPPCQACGTPYEKHGTYPTCASHDYQAPSNRNPVPVWLCMACLRTDCTCKPAPLITA